jgi:hypothetical protein
VLDLVRRSYPTPWPLDDLVAVALAGEPLLLLDEPTARWTSRAAAASPHTFRSTSVTPTPADHS